MIDRKRKLAAFKKELLALVEPFAAKIAPLYEALGWTWHTEFDGDVVPSQAMIADLIRREIKDALHDLQHKPIPAYTSECAGILIEISPEEDEARLAFIVSEEVFMDDQSYAEGAKANG